VSGTSVAGIVVMVVVIMAGLAAMEIFIFVVGGGSYRHHATDRKPGDVRGGIHVGDPGSVAPRREAPAKSAKK